MLAIPVSLIGAFAVMAGFGASLNSLSLFGLVLAIGIVVDDAIVVVENVERNLEAGMSPKEAAYKTMDEVGGALIAIALVLVAVFVPTAFITGISGQFYKQFALTIASATVISLVVSLTLSPAMAALVLRPKPEHPPRETGWKRPFQAFGERFNAGFNWLSGAIRETDLADRAAHVPDAGGLRRAAGPHGLALHGDADRLHPRAGHRAI